MRIVIKYLILWAFFIPACRHLPPRTVKIGDKTFVDNPTSFLGRTIHNYAEKPSATEEALSAAATQLASIQWIALATAAICLGLAIAVGSPLIVKWCKRVGVAAFVIWGAAIALTYALDVVWLWAILVGIISILLILDLTTDWSLINWLKRRKNKNSKESNNDKGNIPDSPATD